MNDPHKQRLIEEHRKRLEERKKKKNELESQLRRKVLEDVEGVQRTSLLVRIDQLLNQHLAALRIREKWSRDWQIYLSEWEQLGIKAEHLSSWYDIGIDKPYQAQAYQNICEILGLPVDNGNLLKLTANIMTYTFFMKMISH